MGLSFEETLEGTTSGETMGEGFKEESLVVFPLL
jgi:hypothetical protein